MFKFKIFFIIAMLAGLLLPSSVVRADVVIISYKEPIKNAVNCESFFLGPETEDMVFVVNVSQVSEKGVQEYYDLVKEGECYLTDPNPNPNFGYSEMETRPKGLYLNQLYALWKNDLPENFISSLPSTGDFWLHDNSNTKHFIGSVQYHKYFGAALIKKYSPILNVAVNITLGSATTSASQITMGMGKTIDATFVYDVLFEDGTLKKMGEEEFEILRKENAPTKNENTSNYNRHYSASYNLAKKINFILKLVGLLFLSFFIEAVVFYFFGSRHKRNYVYLFLANLISYPSAYFCLYVLSNISLFDSRLPDDPTWNILFIWFYAEALVFFIEYGIMLLALRKYYPKKQIALFVFIANLVTALIGLILSLYLS